MLFLKYESQKKFSSRPRGRADRTIFYFENEILKHEIYKNIQNLTNFH